MKRIISLHIFFLISILCTYSSANDQVCFSIQTGSFEFKEKAVMQYAEIEQKVEYDKRRNLRVEFIDPYYTVRFGKFSDYESAQQLLAELPNLPEALIVEAFYLSERFLISNLSETPAEAIQEAKNRQLRMASIVTQAGNIHNSVTAVTRKEKEEKKKEYPLDSNNSLTEGFDTSTNLRKFSFLYVTLFVAFVAVLLLISLLRRSNNHSPNSIAFGGLSGVDIPTEKILEDNRFTILMHLQSNPPQNIDDACRRIETITGVQHNPNDVRRFIKSLGHLT